MKTFDIKQFIPFGYDPISAGHIVPTGPSSDKIPQCLPQG